MTMPILFLKWFGLSLACFSLLYLLFVVICFIRLKKGSHVLTPWLRSQSLQEQDSYQRSKTQNEHIENFPNYKNGMKLKLLDLEKNWHS